MRRRQFIAGFGGAGLTWPLAARAQQPAMPVVGFLQPRSPESDAHVLAAFRNGLSDIGYFEGRNVAIVLHWAEGHYDRLPAFAADLVRRRVAVIVTIALPPVLAAKAATTTIPILFSTSDDPVAAGLVASLSRPGSNLTGFSTLATALAGKQLQLLRDGFAKTTVVGLLVNPTNPTSGFITNEARAAAHTLGQELHIVTASRESDFETAFENLARQGVGALLASTDSFFLNYRHQLTAMAARYAMPVIYDRREYVEVGGLMSYGVYFAEIYRSLGVYAGRILKGERPQDLPVQQATKLQLVVNSKTAKALGIIVPPMLLAIADDVIE